jgi:hypothetical protein
MADEKGRAVYFPDVADNGEAKALMFLYPRSKRVAYTRYGAENMQFSGLSPLNYALINGISPYELAFSTVNGINLVDIPYIKGRSEEEIRRLVREELKSKEININDVSELVPQDPSISDRHGREMRLRSEAIRNIGPRKNNIYCGDIVRLIQLLDSENLETEATLQRLARKRHRGGGWYNDELLKLEKIDNLEEGYQLLSTLSLKGLFKKLKICKILYFIIDAIFFGNPDGHAMAIIIDASRSGFSYLKSESKKFIKGSQEYPIRIEIFDSNGMTPNTRHVYFWTTEIAKKLLEMGYKSETEISAETLFCPQGFLANRESSLGRSCSIWAYYYLWLKIHNPKLNANDIQRYIEKLTQDRIDLLIANMRRISTLAYSELSFGPNEKYVFRSGAYEVRFVSDEGNIIIEFYEEKKLLLSSLRTENKKLKIRDELENKNTYRDLIKNTYEEIIGIATQRTFSESSLFMNVLLLYYENLVDISQKEIPNMGVMIFNTNGDVFEDESGIIHEVEGDLKDYLLNL